MIMNGVIFPLPNTPLQKKNLFKQCDIIVSYKWRLKPETWNHYTCPTNPATAIAPFTHSPTHTELRETLWKKKAPNEYT